MVTDSHYLMLICIIAINSSTLGVEQVMMQDMFAMRGYDNQFCGIVYSINNLAQMVCLIPIARVMDKTSNHLVASKFSGLFFASSLLAFNVAMNMVHERALIVVTCLLVSLGLSLVYTSMVKIMYIAAVGFVPEATVGASFLVCQQFFTFALNLLVSPMRAASKHWLADDSYQVPLAAFAVMVLALNAAYAFAFKQPDPVKLRAKVRRS